MRINLPNQLTLARIVLIPVFVGVLYLPDTWLSSDSRNLLSMLIFVVAAVTDWFDGYLARRLQQTSSFGAFLDPVADKLMVAAALIVLVDLDRVSAVIALVIVGREIAISALREWMAQIGATASVAVAFVGKLKTAVQMIAIPLLLLDRNLAGLPLVVVGNVLLAAAAGLTLWSMGYYFRKAMPGIRERVAAVER